MGNIKENADLTEALTFDRAFQEKFREAMRSMMKTPQYHKALDCFHAAYAYRKSFPWLPESRDTRDEMKQDGLSYALRAALSTFIVPERATLEALDVSDESEDVWVEDWKCFEAGWTRALVSAVDATISEGFSLKRFENQLGMAGIDVADISHATLQVYIAAALIRYYKQRNNGLARDPL